MAQWTCPACGFTAEGEDADVELERQQHMADNANDLAHQQTAAGTQQGVEERGMGGMQ